MSPQKSSFYASLTARENLDVIRRILGLRKNTVEDALELVELSEFGDRLAEKYSLGMKQQLGLAGRCWAVRLSSFWTSRPTALTPPASMRYTIW